MCVHARVYAYRDASRSAVRRMREGGGGGGQGKNAQELNESVTAHVFFYDSVFRGLGRSRFFPEQRRRAVNHYLFLYFTLSSGGERNERGSDGTERVGKKRARESGRKSEGRGCFGERRALE